MPSALNAKAFEVGVGFSAIEEGDDRVRPGAMLHLGLSPFYSVRGYLYGRDFGPVKERTTIFSFNRRMGIFKSNALQASFGLALMDEVVTLKFEDDDDSSYNTTEHNYNAGTAFGISWSLIDSGPLFVTVSWDAHLFPAGLNGGLFLVAARKQSIAFAMGVAF
jgi:hypothetical protein